MLLHTIALGSPDGELVGIRGELVLHCLNNLIVVKEEDGAGSTLEHGHLVARRLPAGFGNDGFEDVGGNVPELVVLGAEEDDGAVGLGVEGGRSVQGGLVDEFLDALGGDGEVLAEGVESAAGLGHLKEDVGREFGGHFSGFVGCFCCCC